MKCHFFRCIIMNRNEYDFVSISEEVGRFLNDDRFLLWCLIPDEESELFWNALLLENPQKKEFMIEAKNIVRSFQFNNYRLSEEETEQLHARLLLSLKKRRIIRRQWLIGVAASLLLVFSLSIWRYLLSDTSEKEGVDQFDITRLYIDESQTEIELLVSNQEKFLLPNEAKIKLESSGDILMGDAKISTTPGQGANTMATSPTSPTLNTLKVPNGRRSYLTLSDGTKVWINAGTVLSFPTVFETDNRIINVSGEIYLEVAMDTHRPFIIQTSEMEVEVLGTSFNIRAYAQDNEQSVVLVDGLVAVRDKSGRAKEIHPNTRLIISDLNMKTEKVDVYNYISWCDGVLQFELQSLGYVISCLSRYYNLSFECDTATENLICSGKLVLFNDVTRVMNTLERSFPITCEQKGNRIKLNKKF